MRILYIDIDSLRPDHLGCYGYVRDTSPAIDGLAARGARFNGCYTTDAPCLPSRAALFSGRPGIQNGVVAHEGPGAAFRYPGDGHTRDPRRLMWMEALQEAGYRTVGFSSFARRHLAWWFTAGFSEYYGHQLPGGHETADEVDALVVPWLEQNAAGDNWFCHVTYWDVHTPYRAPQEFVDRVASQPVPAWPDAATLQRQCRKWYGPRTAPHFFGSIRDGKSPFPNMPDAIRNREEFKQMCDGYDAGITRVDDAIARLLRILEEAGVRDETAVIVSADHGEALGEQGMFFEHGNAGEGVAHVPLVVDWPGLAGGQVSDAPIAQLDLPATVLELLGVERPELWEGQPFSPALRGDAFPGRDHLIWGCGIYAFQRAVRTRDWLFVRTLHPGCFPHDPLMLFDMNADSWQQQNVAEAHPAETAHHDHLLANWWHQHCTGVNAVRDPFLDMMDIGPDIYCSTERTEWMIERANRPDQLEDFRARRAPLNLKHRPGPPA